MSVSRLYLLIFAAACDATVASDRAGVSVTDSAGVAIVTNQRPSWTATSGWHVDSVPITSIGGDDRDIHQQFQYVGAARRLSDGRVVIATANDFRWFDANGKYLMTSSRAGDGPGEFRYLSTLHRAVGDTVIAGDGMGRRVSTFGPDGVFIREQRLDLSRFAALGRWEECASALLPDGSRYTCKSDPTIPATLSNRPSRMVKPGWSSPGPGHLRQLKRTYLVPATLDTAYPMGIVAGIEQFGVRSGTNGEVFLQHPFYSYSLIASGGHPMRIVSITNPDYRIEIWTPKGTLERVILRTNGRRAPTREERADARAQMLTMHRRMADPVTLARLVDAVPTPDSLPAAVGLVVSDSGEIVVQREGFPAGPRASAFDVFGADGRWLGAFQFAPRTLLIEVGIDYLLTVRLDADDAPHVEVLRLHRRR
ncbi:MAG: hypothetical protein IPP90_07840 [Gemmatimonadaceae bacterium]|nr:hypothetical protein [Gemmatimonadaceae bacterium]